MAKNYLYKLLFAFSLITATAYAQQLPPVSNFSPKVYKAQNQNWAISQTKNKTIYIANNSGLLAYDGASWKLYKSPNETIFRSVKVINERVYTGCYMEFGYWQQNEFNQLVYTSLSENIKSKLKEDEQFWNIIQFENKILFQSLNSIYIYDTNLETFNIITSKSVIYKIFKVNNEIFFQQKNEGLYKIENGQKMLVSSSELVKNNKIVGIFNLEDSLLLLTQNDGFFKFSDGKFSLWKTYLNTQKNLGVYNTIQLKNKSFAIGTISNGLIHLNKNGKYQYQINQNNGLINNTVLSLFEDSDSDIWLGLDNGVSLINQQSPFKIFNDYRGEIGSVYTSIIVDNTLYLGTNQGLFYKEINTNTNFKFIEGTKGQVWNLRWINNTLFCGHNNGTFVIKNNKATNIAAIEGAWDFKKINDTKILQGNYSGLYVLENEKNTWVVRNKINGFDISSKFFEIKNNQIFVNHEYKGVLKLTLDSSFSKVQKIEKDTIHKSINSSLVKYLNDIYYAGKNGIFKYYAASAGFKKDTTLSKIYANGYVSGKLTVNQTGNEMWAFSNENVVKIEPSKLSNLPQITQIPLSSAVRKSVEGYENILQLSADSYLLCTATGYIEINSSQFPVKDFNIALNTVSTSKNKLINSKKEGVFNNNNNNIHFTYSVAEFDKYLQPNYQYKLKGLSNNWSTWTKNSTKTFENLPSGNYEFLARAKVGNTISNNTISYNFTIKKPWYLSNGMILLYCLGFVLFYVLMHTIYRAYYKKQQKELIAQTEKEKKLAQAENEKEIIKIKNEKLREDFKSKSKELAATIMNVVKKNELLADIKNQLQKVNDKEVVKPVIKTIDRNLKDNADWEFFQEAFNNADSEFLKRLKSIHPTLTPNDLKLCAYLRLNLSSKEIAPLFNISPRSVEIKRYRLRKKMNLPHEQNLQDYVIKL